jgi:hypothetical protein
MCAKKLRQCNLGVAQSPKPHLTEQVGKVLPGQHRRRPVTGTITQQDNNYLPQRKPVAIENPVIF